MQQATDRRNSTLKKENDEQSILDLSRPREWIELSVRWWEAEAGNWTGNWKPVRKFSDQAESKADPIGCLRSADRSARVAHGSRWLERV